MIYYEINNLKYQELIGFVIFVGQFLILKALGEIKKNYASSSVRLGTQI